MATRLDRTGIEVRLVRLEEVANSLKATFATTQWAGGLFLGLILLLVGSLLARTFTLGDQIAGLTTTVAQTNERVGVLEATVDARLGAVEAALGGVQAELARLRAAAEERQGSLDERAPRPAIPPGPDSGDGGGSTGGR
jgi:hypothetical protein